MHATQVVFVNFWQVKDRPLMFGRVPRGIMNRGKLYSDVSWNFSNQAQPTLKYQQVHPQPKCILSPVEHHFEMDWLCTFSVDTVYTESCILYTRTEQTHTCSFQHLYVELFFPRTRNQGSAGFRALVCYRVMSCWVPAIWLEASYLHDRDGATVTGDAVNLYVPTPLQRRQRSRLWLWVGVDLLHLGSPSLFLVAPVKQLLDEVICSNYD